MLKSSFIAGALIFSLALNPEQAFSEVMRGIEFSDKTHVSLKDSASSAADIRANMMKVIENQHLVAPSIKSGSSDQWATTITLLSNPENTPLEHVCNKYIRYHMAPLMKPVPKSYSSFVLNIQDESGNHLQKCNYDVIQQVLLAKEGTTQALMPRLRRPLKLPSGLAAPHKFLYNTSYAGVNRPIEAYMVVVPVTSKDSLEFAEAIEQIAEELSGYIYSHQEGLLIYALPANQAGTGFRFPGRQFLAVADDEGRAIIEAMRLKYTSFNNSKVTEDDLFLEIDALSSELQRAMSPEQAVPKISKEYIIEDASELVLDVIGWTAANLYRVNRIVVRFEAPIGESNLWYRIPVTFVKTEGRWVRQEIEGSTSEQ